LRRAYGLRLFFIPAARERLGNLLVAAGAALYALRAVAQLLALRVEVRTADFPVFYDAARALAAGRDPYQSFLAHCPGYRWCLGGYIYPPLLAEVFRPLTGLDVVAADAVWIMASHLMLAGAAWATYRAVRTDLPRGGGRLLLAASLFFLPLYQNLYAGSVGAPLLLLLALSAWAYVRAQDAAAGVALAAGAVLRLTPAAMAPLLLRCPSDLRRPAAAAAALAAGLVMTATLFALTPYTLEYVSAVLPRISAGTDFVSNVSLPGVLLRLQRAVFGGPLPGSGLVGVGLALGCLGWTWRSSFGIDGRPARAVAFAAFLAATSLVSSVTWNYHLVNELLVLALLLPWLGLGRHAGWMALLSYPLLWCYSDGILAAVGLHPAGPATVVAYLAVTSLNALGMGFLWLACLDVLAGIRQRSGMA
jgi:hypothetical protein